MQERFGTAHACAWTFLSSFGEQGTGPGQWDFPGKPCLDPDGRLLVPDSGNGRVDVHQQDGTFRLLWGSPGTANGQFTHPTAVATDAAGTVYVLDKDNHRIQKFANVSTNVRASSWGALKRLYR